MKKRLTALFALILLGGLAQAGPVTLIAVTGVSVPVKAPLPLPTMSKNCGSGGC